eukprot:scaffold41869_cov66-Phaeocystis_antarctica.AAC.1
MDITCMHAHALEYLNIKSTVGVQGVRVPPWTRCGSHPAGPRCRGPPSSRQPAAPLHMRVENRPAGAAHASRFMRVEKILQPTSSAYSTSKYSSASPKKMSSV